MGKYYWTFTVSTASGYVSDKGYTHIFFGNAGIGTLLIAGMKLELGDVATPWNDYESDRYAKFVEISAPATVFKNNEPESITLTAVCSGFTPTSYQWYKNGTAITGKTSSTCVVTEPGAYKVIVDSLYEDTQSIIAVTDGEDSFACSVSNENFTIATDTDFKPVNNSAYDVIFTAYRGIKQLAYSTDFTISKPANNSASAGTQGSLLLRVTINSHSLLLELLLLLLQESQLQLHIMEILKKQR